MAQSDFRDRAQAGATMTDSPRLLEPHELAELGPPEAVRLPATLIDANPQNPRKLLAEVDQLAESIGDPKIGLLQPIIVRRTGSRYEVIGGHRRLAAFRLLREQRPHEPQWATIPSVVRSMDDDAAYLALLAAQLQTRNWAPREEASALESLASSRTLDEVGRLIHKSAVWVSHRLRVYNDAVLSPMVQLGRLAATVADEIRQIKDPDIRRDFAERAIAEGWSKDYARRQVRTLRLDAQIREIGRQARALLETLSAIDATRLPPDTASDLWKLQRRIVAMGRGTVLPTIAEAERQAGINPNAKPKPKRKRRRTMPAPA